jgi:CDP-diacylglycerol--serine O-phosphatidyltransferase
MANRNPRGNHTPYKYKSVEEASRIYLLPNLFTAGNLFFGFLAIIRCIQAKYSAIDEIISQHYYTQAVWFILLACVCDVFDGLVARLGRKESLFGKEFDSIADSVSFGVAPALMVFFLILSPTEGLPFFRQVGWLIGFIYLLCGSVRLARFNVLTSPLIPQNEFYKNSKEFVGLPIPAAAGVIASLVLVLINFDLKGWSILLPALMLLIAWLMVSSIPYPSLKNLNWHTEARFLNFILLAITVATGFLFHEFAFLILFLCYIFFGLFRHIGRCIKDKKQYRNH